VYVILTTRPGKFRTELEHGLCAVETWDYVFYGRRLARFTIARLDANARIRIVDETDPRIVNRIPARLVEQHESVERAREALRTLTRFGSLDARLVLCAETVQATP
jgi:hypothetical protein